MLLVHKSASLSRCISSLHAALQVYMASSGSKKYHWTDVQLYALGLAGQNASNQDKTTDVQLGMEIANTYKQHLQRALADMLVSWEDVHAYSLDDLVQVRTALAPVTLWNKFKDLQKKGKCLTARWKSSGRAQRGTKCSKVREAAKDDVGPRQAPPEARSQGCRHAPSAMGRGSSAQSCWLKGMHERASCRFRAVDN